MGRDAAPREGWRLLALAALLAPAQAGMIALAPTLMEQNRPGASRILAFVGLALLGGAAWFAAIGPLERLVPGRAAFGAVIIFGAVMRLGWLGTPLVLDTDALRYLWDGAQAAHGIWPWAAPPAAGLPPELAALRHAAEHLPGHRPDRFAAGALGRAMGAARPAHHHARRGGRGDAAAGGPTASGGAACHARGGLVVLPAAAASADECRACDALLLGALLATLCGRGALAGGLLGLAAGVKLWPVRLVPLVARWLPARARLPAGAAFGLAAILTLGPLLASAAAPDAGLNAFARGWVANNTPLSWVQAAFGRGFSEALRPLLALGGGVVALAVARPPPGEPAALIRYTLVAAAATFYLSPEQFP